jgi:site-specific DNA-methyltransferase (adenine-specific)
MNDKCLADYKYYFSERFNLFSGNSLEVLPFIADNSIDSVVTDPPYELGFMGKSWDSTGIANDPKLWKEVLRVLKPGGHLLSFGGSRTYHRMAVAIEDAGFEIRDQIM